MLLTQATQTNVDQNQLSIVYYTHQDPVNLTYDFNMQLIGSIKNLDANVLGYIDLTMAVEFRKDADTEIKDVAGCKLRLNQSKNKLENVKAVDYLTKTSVYNDLKTIQEDEVINGQNWSLTTIDIFKDETEFYCQQQSHCYVTCNLQRQVYPNKQDAENNTNTSEDALFYTGAKLEVLGTYFAYTDVPGQGQLLWSKGKSNDWQEMKILNGGSDLHAVATSLLLLLIFN